ncbi:MAG TPA: hypothetical protein VKD68_01090, partial [Methyloceanibacter sp.]|nr:hypothetical protein [Methyloceanibacter sp.]
MTKAPILSAAAAALLLGLAAAPVVAEDAATPAAPAPSATPTLLPTTPAPATPAKGEFDNSCTFGLTTGQVVKTDCSINWTAPDGKIYCFSRESSKEAFLKNPAENIQKAKEFFIAQGLAKDTAGATAPAAAPAAASQPAAATGGTKEFTEDDV